MPATDVLDSEMVQERAPRPRVDAARTDRRGQALRRQRRVLPAPPGHARTGADRVLPRFRESRTERDLRGNRSSGGSFYVTKARDLGQGYVRTVVDAHSRSVIDSATASAFLDAKVNQIGKLAEKARL